MGGGSSGDPAVVVSVCRQEGEGDHWKKSEVERWMGQEASMGSNGN